MPETTSARVPAVAAVLGLAVCLAMPTAQAQTSNVTVFGIMDIALRQVHNEGRGTVQSVVSGANSTSRLGVRGSEDLGGSLFAGFHLEHGIQADLGSSASATQFWDRRSTVSLVSKSLGELRLGRDFVPTYSNWGRYDPFAYVGVAGANNFVSAKPVGPIRAAFGSGGNTTVRSSNALQYLLPAGLGGLEGGVMLAPGEGGTAANGQHKLVGVRLGYTTAAFGVSAAYTRSDNNLTVAGAIEDTVLAGNTTVAGVRLTAGVRTFRYDKAKQVNLLLAGVVPVGPLGELKVSWQRMDMRGRVGATVIDRNDASQLGLGYVHLLSKRSALYGTVSRIDNRGGATMAVPGGPAGMAGGGTSTGVEAGMRHSF
ncbi:MAG: porin [Pseudomonadota bacterium]